MIKLFIIAFMVQCFGIDELYVEELTSEKECQKQSSQENRERT